MVKKNTMNLFELHDYIELLEKRIEKIEKLIGDGKKEKEEYKLKPPFYYQKRLKDNQ